jgi:hypothetical protein
VAASGGSPGRRERIGGAGMKRFTFILLALLILPGHAFAQTMQPSIGVTTDIEDGKKMVRVLVALGGKPIENVALKYFVQRSFGNILLGEDTTLDDGSSAVAFPSDLPGAPDGQLHFIVQIKSPAQYATTSAKAAFPADVMSPATAEAFPRALWAPHAPLPLMFCIFGLLAGVWLSYLFVVGQIFTILKGGKS